VSSDGAIQNVELCVKVLNPIMMPL